MASRQPDTTRSIFYALGANILVAIVKFIGALFTGSSSLLAESLHSIADGGNEVLLLWGRSQAKAPPTAIHPLGQGRATFFWSFIVALLLFSMGGVASIYEGFDKLTIPESLESPGVAVGILIFAAIAEIISMRVILQEINKVRGARTLWRWFQETRRSEMLIVFGENGADLAGIGIAFVAILLTMITGNRNYDAVGSIIIGILLILVAFAIGAEIKSLLIGESAAPQVQRDIKAFLSKHHEIRHVLDLITLQHGEDIMVVVTAQMHTSSTSRELVDAINHCKEDLRIAFPQIRWIFFEPGWMSNSADD